MDLVGSITVIVIGLLAVTAIIVVFTANERARNRAHEARMAQISRAPLNYPHYESSKTETFLPETDDPPARD